ncbi:hypothetical protein EJB05_17805, partial [Eragrostis curvula]
MIARCPYLNQNNASSQQASNTRNVASGVGRGGQESSGQQRRSNQTFGRGKVNHINADEVEDTPDVVLGEYLVNSTLATVLFDSGASHSFVSSKFVATNGLPTVMLKQPLIIRTPGAETKSYLGCPRVKILLSGVELLANLVVLESQGIDVILGMDWLSGDPEPPRGRRVPVSLCWNSTLETVAAGVPTLAWPLYAEQRMNAVMLSERVGLALRLMADDRINDGVVLREEVAAAVTELMVGEKGAEARQKGQELREAAAKAWAPDGPSRKAFEAAVGKWKMAHHAD